MALGLHLLKAAWKVVLLVYSLTSCPLLNGLVKYLYALCTASHYLLPDAVGIWGVAKKGYKSRGGEWENEMNFKLVKGHLRIHNKRYSSILSPKKHTNCSDLENRGFFLSSRKLVLQFSDLTLLSTSYIHLVL